VHCSLSEFFVLGFLIVLLSSFLFCFQNVIVRVLFNSQHVFGWIHTGGFVTPTLENSFLLMFMRMALVVPLMTVLAPRLHPNTWQDLKQLQQPQQRAVLGRSLVCGGLMFLYLALLYVSLGLIPTGIAITLFFTYPVFTALLSWRMFRDRPTLFRWGIMAFIFIGSALTIPHLNLSDQHSQNLVGIAMGLASGVTYAGYSVLAQKSFEQLHPVPFTWMSFATTLVLSVVCVSVLQGFDPTLPWPALWIGGLLSALFTFSAHLLNNFGIRLIGATSASMIAASNPALTVILAWFTIQETLNWVQISGVMIATTGVALLSSERYWKKM
jgi:drug/metabolite transporter (DMT)-like permease